MSSILLGSNETVCRLPNNYSEPKEFLRYGPFFLAALNEIINISRINNRHLRKKNVVYMTSRDQMHLCQHDTSLNFPGANTNEPTQMRQLHATR